MDERDRRKIEQALQAHGLLNIPQDQNEVVRVIRGVSSLSRTPTSGLKLSNDADLRFLFLFQFTEHLTPGSLTNGTQTDSQLVAIELAHITAQSLALRSSGNLVIFHGRDGLVDELVATALHEIRVPQPNKEEKVEFLAQVLRLYPESKLEDGLDVPIAATLTTNTPNRSQEGLLRASHRSNQPVTARRLIAQKCHDVEELSERTLTVLDTARVLEVELRGRNIKKPQRVLDYYSAALSRGDASMPANVMLVGPPGVGKTDLALLTARNARVACYQMHSPKHGIVGETERRARLQQTVLHEWAPCVAFADEITELMPMERSNFDGDSGASRAVMAALLTALSDESRRGRSLLLASTNVPERVGAAMRSRFTFIPVLHPLKEDFPHIILAIVRQYHAASEVDVTDPHVVEAARIFHLKGANPRNIRAALSNAWLLHGTLTPETIQFAAEDFCASTDLHSAIYADLWAVFTCSSRYFLPWSEAPADYPFPPHFEGVVDTQTGHVNQAELRKRLKDYQSYANV
jgi:hypothetical protein